MREFVSKWKWWLFAAVALILLPAITSVDVSVLPDGVSNYCKQKLAAENLCNSYGIIRFFVGGVLGALKPYSDVITALSGLAVAIFTGTLYFTTRNMWRVSTKQAKIAGRALVIARQQMRIAGGQTDIQLKQHAIGRLQFIADKRPRLRVRHVILHEDIVTRLSDPFTVVNGRLVVVNVGGTDARIINSRYRVFWSDFGLPMDLDLNGPESFPLVGVDGRGTHPLKGGESCSYFFHADGPLGGMCDYIERGHVPLFVVGFVHYADDNDIERFMGFCRKYVVADGTRGARFIAVDDPDYEYED